MNEYTYRVVELIKVTDGDTCWLRLDVGFRQSIVVDVRLHGVDAPERHAKDERERQAARLATTVSEEFLRAGMTAGCLWVQTQKDPDDFGRWLGDVFTEIDGVTRHLGDILREGGLASAWPTRWHEEYLT